MAEAERLKSELPVQPSLASLQGTLLMYERYVDICSVETLYLVWVIGLMVRRYSMSRTDDLGYIMLHEAIRMGESLGLVGSSGPRITSEQLSEDMNSSCRRTAWGLFNVDT